MQKHIEHEKNFLLLALMVFLDKIVYTMNIKY